MFPADKPVDPRGGFNGNNDGCINGTGWGGKINLDGSEAEAPYADYQGHSTGGVSGLTPPA